MWITKEPEEKLLTYYLYPQNLTEPHKSFDPTLTLKDFKWGIDWRNMKTSKTVIYVNPRGHSIILKDKNGEKK